MMSAATNLPTPEFYKELIAVDRALKRAGANRHDRVILLIDHCIEARVDSGSLIIHTLAKLGFDRRHVGKLLNELCGNTETNYRWLKNAEGRYERHARAT